MGELAAVESLAELIGLAELMGLMGLMATSLGERHSLEPVAVEALREAGRDPK